MCQLYTGRCSYGFIDYLCLKTYKITMELHTIHQRNWTVSSKSGNQKCKAIREKRDLNRIYSITEKQMKT